LALLRSTFGTNFAFDKDTSRSPNDQQEQRASFLEKRKLKFTGT